MWLIIGTVPEENYPLSFGPCAYQNGKLLVDGRETPVQRGTPALLATCCLASAALGIAPPKALLAGDTGDGRGSRAVYAHLCALLQSNEKIHGLTFHYLLPDLDWHNRILALIQEKLERPLLIADAGYMYVAKMSGYASEYDCFTPDIGELAFLADEKAPHPFYTRGFLLADEEEAPALIARACQFENAARYMLVKGRVDRIVKDGVIPHEVRGPDNPFMEPIGGTGDSLTGLLTALAMSGRNMAEAAYLAAGINRRMGELAKPDPSWSIADLLKFLPEAFRDILPPRPPR